MRVALGVLTLIVLVAVGLLAVVRASWRSRTASVIAGLDEPVARPRGTYSESELDSLPAPVARYFRAVLRNGQPIVRKAVFEQQGTFLVNARSDGWGSFTATEHIVPRPAGFVWDARIRMAPGVNAFVRDAFVGGAGSMEVSLFALVPVTSVRGTRDIAEGALHRYLAESVWVPTALLPSSGVTWSAVDDTTARATVSSGGTTVSADFRFAPDGLVSFVYVESRMRDVNGSGVPTPWLGRFSRWEQRGGMKIPIAGEVGWLVSGHYQPYWRGEILLAAYEPAPR